MVSDVEHLVDSRLVGVVGFLVKSPCLRLPMGVKWEVGSTLRVLEVLENDRAAVYSSIPK